MIRKNFKRLDWVVTLGCATLLFYMGWQGFQSARGFHFLAEQKNLLQNTKLKLADLTSRREVIEAKVRLLRPESVDPDLLDELARSQIGLAAKTDIIVPWPSLNP